MGGLELFSYVDLEDRVPAQHLLRAIRSIVNEVLAAVRSASGPDRPTLIARDDRFELAQRVKADDESLCAGIAE